MFKVKHLLFDADGVLFNSKKLIKDSYRVTCEIMRWRCPEDKLDAFCGPPLRDNLAFIKPGLSEAEMAEAVHHFRVYHDAEENLLKVDLFDKVPETLDKLKQMGIPCFIATSKPRDAALSLLEHHNVLKNFQGVYGSDRAGKKANKALIIQNLIATENGRNGFCITQTNSLMVGDQPVDCLGAVKAAGIRTIGARWGFSTGTTLKEAGVLVLLDRFEQLPFVVERALPQSPLYSAWGKQRDATWRVNALG